MSEWIEEDRRIAAPRHKINLQSWVVVTVVSGNSDDQEQYLFLRALTHDVSLSGLALIVSEHDAQEIRKLGSDLVLRLLLPLSGQPIELEAVPVRFQLWSDDEKEAVLIGARFTNIDDSDKATFSEFIRGCGES